MNSEFEIQDGILKKYHGTDRHVVIPDGVTEIMNWAFEGCKFLTDVTIPESVTSIAIYAFDGCRSLSSLTVYADIESIGAMLFHDLPVLRSVTIPEHHKTNISIDGVIYTKDLKKLLYCPPEVTDITIPPKVTAIGEGALFQNKHLTEIIIPEGVTRIERMAFESCKNLVHVTLPETLAYVGSCAFLGTPWLENNPDDFVTAGNILIQYKGTAQAVTVPENITSIANAAFNNLGGLVSVNIPGNLVNVGYMTFRQCPALTSVMYHGVEFSDKFYLSELLEMLVKKNYSTNIMPVPFSAVCSVIWKQFFVHPDDEETHAYLREHFAEMFHGLIDTEDTETIRKVLDFGFITEKNIDEYILYAIEKQKYQSQVMLTNYKAEQFGYDEDIKKKFTL